MLVAEKLVPSVGLGRLNSLSTLSRSNPWPRLRLLVSSDSETTSMRSMNIPMKYWLSSWNGSTDGIPEVNCTDRETLLPAPRPVKSDEPIKSSADEIVELLET